MTDPVATERPLSLRRVAQTWWPLAASWLLMSFEQPMANVVVARLPQPEVNLAAWGSIVFPLVESYNVVPVESR